MKTIAQVLLALVAAAITVGIREAFQNEGIKQRKRGQNQGYEWGWAAGSNAVRHQQLFKIVDTHMDDWLQGWKDAEQAYTHSTNQTQEGK